MLMLALAELSFLVPMRYSLLFSNQWQLGGQNWLDAISTKNDYILIYFIGLRTVAMATRLQKIPSLNFFHYLSLKNSENYWHIDTSFVKF